MKFKIGDRVKFNPEHYSYTVWPPAVQRAIRANVSFRIKEIKTDRTEKYVLDTSEWPHGLYEYWAENELVHARKPTIVVML